MSSRAFVVAIFLVPATLALPPLARADEPATAHRLFHATFLPAADERPDAARTLGLALSFGPQAPDADVTTITAAPPPSKTTQPFEYSDGYRVRARIHKIASLATLPLFVTEGVVGQSLYNNPTSAKKSAHLAVAAGMGGLFAVNTVTGVWNLIEARKDPNGRGRRMLHSLLMLGADAGFLATAALAPENEHGRSNSAAAHRAMAFTAISMATAGYLVMLIGGR